jgi:hypothetical protein
MQINTIVRQNPLICGLVRASSFLLGHPILLCFGLFSTTLKLHCIVLCPFINLEGEFLLTCFALPNLSYLNALNDFTATRLGFTKVGELSTFKSVRKITGCGVFLNQSKWTTIFTF